MSDYLSLHQAGEQAILEYLKQHPVTTGSAEIDYVLDGGVEVGNYYLFLGSAKHGKSTVLRALGLSLAAKGTPVLYLNFEQVARNVFSKIYSMVYGESLRDKVHTEAQQAYENVYKLPETPFFIATWPDKLLEKSFNSTIRKHLEENVAQIKKDHGGVPPIVIIENLSDIYNERVNGSDSLVNIVTQTAQDIKNFCMLNEVAVFLAHHTAKIGGEEPEMDDVRDSKRVVDLAHSIFAAYMVLEYEGDTDIERKHYRLKYLAGRGLSDMRRWNVRVQGIEMQLEPFVPPRKKPKAAKRK